MQNNFLHVLALSVGILVLPSGALGQTSDNALTKVDTLRMASATEQAAQDTAFAYELERANKRVKTGKRLITAGGVTGVAGAVSLGVGFARINSDTNDWFAGLGGVILGGTLASIALPILISGAVVTSKGKRERRAIEKRLTVSLTGAGASAKLEF